MEMRTPIRFSRPGPQVSLQNLCRGSLLCPGSSSVRRVRCFAGPVRRLRKVLTPELLGRDIHAHDGGMSLDASAATSLLVAGLL